MRIDVWQHVAIVRASGRSTLLVNGRVRHSMAAGPRRPSGRFAIGGNPLSGSEAFEGEVACVRVFTFEPDRFVPARDLLLTPEAAAEAEQAARDHAHPAVSRAPYINQWLVAGPLRPGAVDEETALRSAVSGEPLDGQPWRPFDDRLFSRNYDDYQDLRSYFRVLRRESTKDREVWAHVRLHAAEERRCELRLGADAPVRAYWNGEAVVGSDRIRPDRDALRAPVTLRPGRSHLAIRLRARAAPARLVGLHDTPGRRNDTPGRRDEALPALPVEPARQDRAAGRGAGHRLSPAAPRHGSSVDEPGSPPRVPSGGRRGHRLARGRRGRSDRHDRRDRPRPGGRTLTRRRSQRKTQRKMT